ncbi:MAG: hypothetical protein V1809_12635 [Planctomycetota bacterium]
MAAGMKINGLIAMHNEKVFLSVICLAMITGCSLWEDGGGGTTHLPPKVIYAGQPTTLELRTSVWGYERTTIENRFAEMHCHYRLSGEAKYIEAPFVFLRKEKGEGVYTCTLPPFTKVGGKVEYYIDMKFDGVYSQRGTEAETSIPIVKNEHNDVEPKPELQNPDTKSPSTEHGKEKRRLPCLPKATGIRGETRRRR